MTATKETIAFIVLKAMQAKVDSDTYGVSHALKINADRAEKAADEILTLSGGIAQGSPDRDKLVTLIDAVKRLVDRHAETKEGSGILLIPAAPHELKRLRRALEPFRETATLATELAASPPAALPAGEDLRKQSYEVARHVIGYLEGNCGLSFIDVKQADWDAVTRLVATLAMPSTSRTCPDCGMREACDDECPNAPLSSTDGATR